MRTALHFIFFSLFIFSTLFLADASAQDYTQLSLPDGATARLGKGVITDIQISPDNSRLAIASSIGVWLYDVGVRAQRAPLIRYDKRTVSQMKFSPDSKVLASSRYDKTIQLWNTHTGENLFTFGTSGGPFTALKFLPDNKTLVSQNRKGTIWFWNVTTGKALSTFSPKLPKIRLGKDRIWQLETAMFVDSTTGGVTFAVGNNDGTISIQNGYTGRQIRKLMVQTDDGSSLPLQSLQPYTYKNEVIDGQPAMKWVNDLHFSPDGKTLVNTVTYRISHRGEARTRAGPTEIWDVDTGEQLAVLPNGTGIEFLGDGKSLAITRRRVSTIWDTTTHRKIAAFKSGWEVAFSGDGKTLAVIDYTGYAILDVLTGREIASHNFFEELEVLPERFMVSQDGSILVSAGENGTVALWEPKNIKKLRARITGYTKPFSALTFAPDGKTLASGDHLANIQLWNTHTRSKQWTIKTWHDSLQGLTFTPSNLTLTAVVGREMLQQWNVTTREQTAEYTLPNTSTSVATSFFDDGTGFQLKELAFTPTGEKLVIKNRETSAIEIWNIADDGSPQQLTSVSDSWGPVSLNPDGDILATRSNSRHAAALWDAHTGKRIALLNASKNWIDKLSAWFHGPSIYALAFAQDGKTLAVGTRNHEIQLWDMTTLQRVGILKGHKHVVCELVFSPDNAILASGDTGGNIHLWELRIGNHLTTYKGYEGHKDYIRTLTFAPDGKTLASINGHDGTILLWNVPSR